MSEDKQQVHVALETPDWSMQTALGLPVAGMTLDDWLPFLQALGNHACNVSEQAAQDAGKTISCAKGCGACCRQLVGVSLVEARALARTVAAMPEPRQSEVRARFAEAGRRARQSGLFTGELPSERGGDATENARALEDLGWDYFKLGIACPFLEAESCGIHRERPLLCREFLVTSPAIHCGGARRELVEPVPVRVHLSAALTRATSKIADIPDISVPLVFALDWAEALADEMSVAHDPVRTLKVLLDEIGEARVEPAPRDG